MAWFKLDDQGAFHKKVIKAGNEAYGAWCRMGQWSSNHGTNGLVTNEVGHLIAGSRRLLDRLVASGLLEAAGDDYQIHDFLDYNPAANAVAADRDYISRVRSDAGRKGGAKSGETRRAKRKQPAKQTAADLLPEYEATGSPVPVPDPVPGSTAAEDTTAAPPPPKASGRVVTSVMWTVSAAKVFGGREQVLFGLQELGRALDAEFARDDRGRSPEEFCDMVAHGYVKCRATWSSPGKYSPQQVLDHFEACVAAGAGELSKKGDGQARSRAGNVFGVAPVMKPATKSEDM